MKNKILKNEFDEFGRFVIEDYDHKPAFSSFLPGLAGLNGIPMWVFYVNRGQAVCSFGVENKDHPILEFQSANIAYQDTGRKGFRTFLNANREGKQWHREVFSPWHANDVKRRMCIGMNEVMVQEVNRSLGYQVTSLFFTLVSEPFSGLIRQVSIQNLQESPLDLEIMDGLPGIVPYGVDNGALKHVGRTIQAWMQAENLKNKIPFFRLKATPGDTAAVHAIESGNYALAFQEDELWPALVDPTVIFGRDTEHADAHLFYEQGLEGVLNANQILEGRTPSAFFGGRFTLPAYQVRKITSVFGYAPDLSTVQASPEVFRSPDYVDKKLFESRKLAQELTADVNTSSSSERFDGYCSQTFLDNILRGGIPVLLGDKHVMHVFARKHGDIERDYNDFVLPPEYYSQGNGNYRDVNQNRRNDPFFLPKAGEFNIQLFMSLIQADGYNPLVINGLTFTVPEKDLDSLSSLVNHNAEVLALLQGKFTPGELLNVLSQAQMSVPINQCFDTIFSAAESHIEAEHGEGYWVDHWTYNLDLIESYLSIYPDRKIALLFESLKLPFYDNPHVVQPRKKRFVEHKGKPMQLNAVVSDPEKAALIASRAESQNWARAEHGKGDIFRMPLISKLTLLALIKFATLDPSGMGVLMEAGRPGWYDALNGLPGLFGSSMPETYELVRLIRYLRQTFAEASKSIPLPVEVQILLTMVKVAAEMEAGSFALWDERMTALERYRDAVRLGFDGKVVLVQMTPLLEKMEAILEIGITKAETFVEQVPATYFKHQVTDYSLRGTQDINGNTHIHIKAFKPSVLPPFLEGPVRLMKIRRGEEARDITRAVRDSGLFDEKLGMVKVNASLASQPHEIGRARAFTPGWLENESIWMHMSFKYLLELLNAGLFEEYFEAFEKHLPAFMVPEVYGRSPLENSSFIVSSVHPDKSYHGRGFVARLSGSTAEFLSMWVLMTAGSRPFRIVNDRLALEFSPKLPGWLFKEDGTFSFRFLGACTVTLHNPHRVNTYDSGMTIAKISLQSDGQTIEMQGHRIEGALAEQVRSGEIESIELFYE
jgi:hypothetical protein